MAIVSDFVDVINYDTYQIKKTTLQKNSFSYLCWDRWKSTSIIDRKGFGGQESCCSCQFGCCYNSLSLEFESDKGRFLYFLWKIISSYNLYCPSCGAHGLTFILSRLSYHTGLCFNTECHHHFPATQTAMLYSACISFNGFSYLPN